MSTATNGAAGLTVSGAFHVARRGRRTELRAVPAAVVPRGRVPRVARLMALALRFEGLVQSGVVADHAELARLGHVTRARVSQIMALLHLAPDLQESLLFLPPVTKGRDPLVMRALQPLAAVADWRKQRKMWAALARACGLDVT